MNLGENIYRLRTEKNMSQGALADALEVSRQSVSKWENNSAVPELEKLMKMGELFGVTLDELVGGIGAAEVTPGAHQVAAEQAALARQGLSAQQILGIVLLALGALFMIVLTVVGLHDGLWLLGIFISIPFWLCGTICLTCRKNVGLKCAWVVYVLLWMIPCLWILATAFTRGGDM